jgi:hypothetical protein
MTQSTFSSFVTDNGYTQKTFLTEFQWDRLSDKLFEEFAFLFDFNQALVCVSMDGTAGLVASENLSSLSLFVETTPLPDDLLLIAHLQQMDLDVPYTTQFGYASRGDSDKGFSGKVQRINVVTAQGDSLVAEKEISSGDFRYSNYAFGAEPALLASRLGVELRLNQKQMAMGMILSPLYKCDPGYIASLDLVGEKAWALMDGLSDTYLLPAQLEDYADVYMREVREMPEHFTSNAAAAVYLNFLPCLDEKEAYAQLCYAMDDMRAAKRFMNRMNRTFS